MIDGQNAVTSMYVANTARGANTTIPTLPSKSVAVVDLAGTVQTTAISDLTKRVRIAVKDSAGNVNLSPVFSLGQVSSKTYSAYEAPTQQITAVGYNPATGLGAFDATVNTDYALTLNLLSTSGIYNNTPIIKEVVYNTAATTSQEAIVTGLKTQWDALMAYEPTPFAIIDRTSNGTMTALAGNATVTNGSNVVGVTAHALTAGAYVALAGATYKVASVINANSFTIDAVYTGASGTLTAGTTYATQAGSLATITNWGLKITGLLLPVVNPQTQDYYKVSFFTTLRKPNQGIYSDSGVPIVTVSTPYEGNGTGYKLAIKEYRMNFNNRDITVSSFPTTKIKQEIVPTSTYAQIVINAYDDVPVSVATGVQVKSYYNMIVAVDASLSTDITSLRTVLGL